MAKKKTAPKKNDSSTSTPSKRKVKSARMVPAPAASSRGSDTRSSGIHVYRIEVGENATDAPLVVDLPIAAGRGQHAPRPAFVGFTAEMAEEYWQDQFAFRIISLDGGSVRAMISRVDKGSPELGWGEKLIVQVLVVDTRVDA